MCREVQKRAKRKHHIVDIAKSVVVRSHLVAEGVKDADIEVPGGAMVDVDLIASARIEP